MNGLVSGAESADEKTGDTAVALLRAGAETDKKDVDGFLAMDLAPDSQVMYPTPPSISSADLSQFSGQEVHSPNCRT